MRNLILFSIIFLCSCTATKFRRSENDSIQAIQYIIKLPVVLNETEVHYINDTIPIYFYEDLIIWQLPYTFDSSKMTYHIKADTISSEHILTETRYNYFIYRENNSNGTWYSSKKDINSNKVFSVDSFIKKKGNPLGLRSIIENRNDSLVKKINFEHDKIFIEKYVPKAKPDESYCDTITFYYSKLMRPIQFSFSPNLDSLKDAKLYKVCLSYNNMFSKQYSIMKPARDLIYEIREVKVADPAKLKILIEYYKQHEKL